MRSGRNLTLEEIGARAGVSRSTVSRVLNRHPDVRPEVRERVEAVIEQTGYQPNRAARALVSSRSGLLGLVMPTDVDELFGDPYYSALVAGIQEGCADQDLLFAVFPAQTGRDGEEHLTAQIAQGFVDGVIVTAGPRSEHLIAALRRQNTRMVVVGHPDDDDGLVRVDVENRAGSAAVVNHLIEHGRARIGYVGPSTEHRYGRERYDGFAEALARAGLPIDDELVHRDEPSPEGGYRATLELLAAGPDAVFAATDPMAAGAYRALRERNLTVADDVAVVGFDGLPRGHRLEPALTTVVQPVVEVGRTAVELLVRDDVEPGVVVLPTGIHLGRSCGRHEAVADRTDRETRA